MFDFLKCLIGKHDWLSNGCCCGRCATPRTAPQTIRHHWDESLTCLFCKTRAPTGLLEVAAALEALPDMPAPAPVKLTRSYGPDDRPEGHGVETGLNLRAVIAIVSAEVEAAGPELVELAGFRLGKSYTSRGSVYRNFECGITQDGQTLYTSRTLGYANETYTFMRNGDTYAACYSQS